jgi:hypothetical protein
MTVAAFFGGFIAGQVCLFLALLFFAYRRLDDHSNVQKIGLRETIVTRTHAQ